MGKFWVSAPPAFCTTWVSVLFGSMNIVIFTNPAWFSYWLPTTPFLSSRSLSFPSSASNLIILQTLLMDSGYNLLLMWMHVYWSSLWRWVMILNAQFGLFGDVKRWVAGQVLYIVENWSEEVERMLMRMSMTRRECFVFFTNPSRYHSVRSVWVFSGKVGVEWGIKVPIEPSIPHVCYLFLSSSLGSFLFLNLHVTREKPSTPPCISPWCSPFWFPIVQSWQYCAWIKVILTFLMILEYQAGSACILCLETHSCYIIMAFLRSETIRQVIFFFCVSCNM